MDLKKDIQRCLSERNWNPHRLAKEAGLASDMGIRRVLSGERKGLHSDNLVKLIPFLYGEGLSGKAASKTVKKSTAAVLEAVAPAHPAWIVSTPGVGLTCTACDTVAEGVSLDSPEGRQFVADHSGHENPFSAMRKPEEAEVGA